MSTFGPTTLLGTYRTPRFTYHWVVTCEFPDDEVARKTNRTVVSVSMRRRKLGVEKYDALTDRPP